jgi:hypothetical protein
MAIRRKLFDDLGYFHTDLNHDAGDLSLAAGDAEIADRICKADWQVHTSLMHLSITLSRLVTSLRNISIALVVD